MQIELIKSNKTTWNEREGRGGGAKVAVVSNVSVVECSSMSFGKASFLIFKLLLTPLSENLRVTFQF